MTPAIEDTTVRLDLDGMTCASCAARIERKLNKLDGVAATVNFATEQPTVHCDGEIPVDRLVAAVEARGVAVERSPPTVSSSAASRRSISRC